MPIRPEDEDLARKLLASGWRQASVLSDVGDVELDVRQGFDPKTECLVVCTQSCGLVSPNFTANPDVELLVATRLTKLNPRSPEATGKSVREFHLPTSGTLGSVGLRCDVNRRFWTDRRVLAGRTPENFGVSRKDARRFAGWLSRFYGRAALPNLLIHIASKQDAPFSVIKDVLSEIVAGTSAPVSEGIEAIYVNCDPEDELEETSSFYDLMMRILCFDQATQEHLDRALLSRLAGYKGDAIVERLKFNFVVELTSETAVSDLSNFERFSEWDYLSGLDEIRSLQNR